MRFHLFLFIFAILTSIAFSSHQRSNRIVDRVENRRRKHEKKPDTRSRKPVEVLEIASNGNTEFKAWKSANLIDEDRKQSGSRPTFITNPCAKIRCKTGKECILDKKDHAKCVCIQECPNELTIDDAVCGTNNRTYESECALWRTKCMGAGDKKSTKKLKRLKVKYLGPCKELSSCANSELAEYPTRMRSWLKNVFLQMYDTPAEEGGLSEKQRHYGRKLYSQRDRLQAFEEEIPDLMEREFEKFYPLYKYPIHWKFAQLDRRPKDTFLNKRELEPLRAPLIPMEHCTKAFFKRADKNKDKLISLQEWGIALGLKEDDIDPRLTL